MAGGYAPRTVKGLVAMLSSKEKQVFRAAVADADMTFQQSGLIKRICNIRWDFLLMAGRPARHSDHRSVRIAPCAMVRALPASRNDRRYGCAVVTGSMLLLCY